MPTVDQCAGGGDPTTVGYSLKKYGDGTYSCIATINNTGSEFGGRGYSTTYNYDANKNYITGGDSQGNAVDKSGEIKKGNTSCSGILVAMLNPGACLTRALFAGIASFLIYIGVECLTASGLLFEAILKYTVVSFQTPMYTSVQDAVNNVWTVFRDISNILIIGFFVFIAISTILGVSEYGAKKLLSRVLIVAVLINFSLLFTKLVIDASNFTAFQFYNASLSNADQGSINKSTVNSADSAAIGQSQGIAGTFIQYLGVTGFADSYNAIRKIQDENDDASTGLVIGVLSFVFLIATALVFLYGSFILVARAVLFIFLLITSSLAFATYLIPKLADNYGWSKWWDSLFKNAILAPILMMMLWATLAVAAGIKGAFGNTGTLGKLATDPTAAGNITALLNFVIILGLLFASFKLASKFSSGLGGFNVARLGLGLAGFGALSATAGAAGMLGRNTLGWSAAKRSEGLDESIKAKNLHLSKLADGTAEHSKALQELQNLRKQKSAADKTAKRDFNFMTNAVGAAIAKRAGASAPKAGGGFIEPRKKAAEEAAKSVSDLVVSKKVATDEARKVVEEESAKQLATLQSQKDIQQQAVDTMKQSMEAAKNSSGAVAHRDNSKAEIADATRMKAEHDQQVLSGAMTRAAHQSALQNENDRIRRATETLGRAENVIKNIELQHTTAAPYKTAEALIADIDKDIQSVRAGKAGQVVELATRFQDWSTENAASVAAHETHADDFTANLIRGNLKKNASKNISDTLKDLLKQQNNTPTPPSHP